MHIEVPSQINYTESTAGNEHCHPSCNDVSDVIQSVNVNNAFLSGNEFNFDEHKNGAKQMHLFGATQDSDGMFATNKLIASTTTLPLSVTPAKLNESVLMTPSKVNDDIATPFTCHICACSFRSLELQQMHMQLVHEIFTCRSLDLNEPPKSADSSTNMLQCHLCPKRFKMNGSLRLHARMVHGVSHVPQKIRSISTASGIAQSITNEIQAGDPIPTAMNRPIENPTNSQHANANQIDYYSNYTNMDAIFGKNDGPTVDNANNGSINNGTEPIVGNDDRVHECDICCKRFTTKYFLKKHKRLHTGKC